MKNKDLFTLYRGLEAVSNLGGARFSYGISKNKKIIIAELQTIEETRNPPEAFNVYDSARIKLCRELAEKDENGNPKELNGSFVIADKKEFDKRLEELRAEHATAISEYEEKMKEHGELLETESSIELFTIKQEVIPEEITPALLDPILSIIEE